MSKLVGYLWTDDQIQFILDLRAMDFTFVQIADQFNEEFADCIPKPKSPENIRAQYNKYAHAQFDSRVVENAKSAASARTSNRRLAQENRALLEYLDQQKTFEEVFQDILDKNPRHYHKPVKKLRKSKTKRVIFAHLSDTHFQAQIDEENMGGINRYTSIEEARRLAFFFREVANYKVDKRRDTELVLALNGDLAQGVIHDPESTPVMTTQFAATLHLLTQGISYLAGQFKRVRIVCTQGNHLRYMHKSNKGRQTKQKWDGFHTNIHIALKYALQQYDNVEFEIPVTPYALVDILGHKFFINHGDTVLSPGNIGKNVSTERIKNGVNDLVSGLGDIDVVVMGHVHVPAYTTLNNGTELVVNGTMSGVDEFAQSIGIMKNLPTQQMFEITENYAVGDMRFVRLQRADDDENLDNIIKPFEGKF